MGFLNSLIHLPGVCPDVPEEYAISRYQNGERMIDDFWNNYSLKNDCPGLYVQTAHSGIGSNFSLYYKGHGAIFLRQPEQRLASAYNYHYHSWPREQLPL